MSDYLVRPDLPEPGDYPLDMGPTAARPACSICGSTSSTCEERPRSWGTYVERGSLACPEPFPEPAPDPEVGVTDRDILEEARALVNGDRAGAYGDDLGTLPDVAAAWSLLFDCGDEPFTARDVALMMVMLKLTREAHQHKRDNLVDAAGYLLLASRCAS